MEKIEKIKYEKGYIFRIITEEGTFSISFCGNLDLYFNYECEESILNAPNSKVFVITKENYYLYSIFYKLYENIKNCNVYDEMVQDDEISNETILFKEELNNNLRESEKNNPRRLFCNESIDFHSDDYSYEESSRLIIKKLEDEMEITFVKGRTDILSETFAVRICNSGSRYKPFNVLFMQLYNDLIEYEPEFHQINIEEMLFEMKRIRKK